MRKLYVLLSLILAMFIQKNNYAQPLTRKFSHQLINSLMEASISLENGDLLTYSMAETDLDPHPVYSTNCSAGVMHYLSRYSTTGELLWYASIYAPNHIFPVQLVEDANNDIYLAGQFYYSIDFNIGGTTQTVTAVGNDDIVFAKYSSSGSFQWVKTIAGTGEKQFQSINIISNGNLAITGLFKNTADFDPGPGTMNLTNTLWDSFVAFYDLNGNYVNMGPYTQVGSQYLYIHGIKSDANNSNFIYGQFRDTFDIDPGPGVQLLTSPSNYSVFVCKLDPSGQLTWGNKMGRINSINHFNFEHSDKFFITGQNILNTDFDPSGAVSNLGYAGSFIAVYDTSFNLLSVIGFEPDGLAYDNFIRINSLTTDLQGNIIAAGELSGDVDFDPGPGVQILSTFGPSDYDSFLLRLDSSNQLASVDQFGGNNYQTLDRITRTNNNIWLTGYFEGEVDVELGPATWNYSNAEIDEDVIIANYYLCNPTYNTISQSICHGQNFIFANDTLTDAGTYTRYFTNATGCDSIVVLNLDVNYVDNRVVLQDSVFHCEANNAQFQWYNCTTLSNVPGATANNYVAPDYDKYSAIITQNGCTAMSTCMFRYENLNTNVPVLDWAYNTPFDIYNNVDRQLDTDYDQNILVGCGYYDLSDFDITSGETFIDAYIHDDMAVATYRPDASLKSAFASGYYNWVSTEERTYCTLVDEENNAIAIGKYTEAFDIDPDTGIAMLPPTTVGGVFITKLNSLNQLQWAVGLAGDFNVAAADMGHDASFVICGSFYGNYDIDPGPATLYLPFANECFYVAKFSPSGQLITAFSIFNNNPSGYTRVKSIAIDQSGNMIIGGNYSQVTDFAPGAGTFTLSSPVTDNAFVAKYSPTGQFIWAIRRSNVFDALSCDFNNNIFAGYNQPGVIEKYDSSGAVINWANIQPVSGSINFLQFQSDNTGDLNVLSDFYGVLSLGQTFSSPGSSNTLVMRFKNNLSFKWGFQLNCVPISMRVDDKQNTYLCGWLLYGPCDLDPGTDSLILSPGGASNIFLAKYGYTCATPTSISGNTLLCQGNSTVLNAGPGFSAYSWSNGATTQTINVSTAGTYYVDATNSLGCVSHDSVTVVVNPLPVPVISAATTTLICLGDSVLLSATPGYSNYQWQRNTINLTGAVSQDYYAKSSGRYRCVVTDSGCTGTSNLITVRIVCMPPGPNHERIAYEENDTELEVTAIPNPSTNNFRIISNCDVTAHTDLVIYDSSNREIRKLSNYQNGKDFLVEGLAPGIYFGKLSCELGTKIVKIILLE